MAARYNLSGVGMNGIGLFGCERRGDILRVHGIERGDAHEIVLSRVLPNDDVLVLVRCPGHTGWSEMGRSAYYPTWYAIWRLVPIKGEWSFDCTLREQPRVSRSSFSGWYRIEETIRHEEPGRKRAIVSSMEREVREIAMKS